MARFVRGDVVVVPFPFSREEGSKRRPAVILASWPFKDSNDYLLCLVSAQPASDAIGLAAKDFAAGSLRTSSYARPFYLFAAEESLIDYRAGSLKGEKVEAIIAAIIGLLS